MPKLDTYRDIKDFADPAILAKSNLPRNERSLVVRLLCGILPLEVETGRYKDKDKKKKDRKQRFCKVCETTNVEDEIHFLFVCTALNSVREDKLDPILTSSRETRKYSSTQKLTWLLSRENIKSFGQAMACLYQKRQDLLFSKR